MADLKNKPTPLQITLMKVLMMPAWTAKDPKGHKVLMPKFIEILGKAGGGVAPKEEEVLQALNGAKGPGWVNTNPKILDKDDWHNDKKGVQLWITPIGKTTLGEALKPSG